MTKTPAKLPQVSSSRTESPASDRSAPNSISPTPLLWFRWGLWALLIMVLVGLVGVWWQARELRPPPVTEPLPVLSQLPSFDLITSDGRAFDLADLKTPWIADFIFTRCALTCPRMTSRMRALGESIPSTVRRLSITVDPDHDTPAVLQAYAKAHGVTGDDWLFLTGAPDPLRQLIREHFLLGLSDADPADPAAAEEPITHSSRFVLVDAERQIRGYYDAFDKDSFESLIEDAVELTLENPSSSGDPNSMGGEASRVR